GTEIDEDGAQACPRELEQALLRLDSRQFDFAEGEHYRGLAPIKREKDRQSTLGPIDADDRSAESREWSLHDPDVSSLSIGVGVRFSHGFHSKGYRIGGIRLRPIPLPWRGARRPSDSLRESEHSRSTLLSPTRRRDLVGVETGKPTISCRPHLLI